MRRLLFSTGTVTGRSLPMKRRYTMNRDELIRELRMHSATWQAVVVVYALIVGTMVLSAMAIL